MHELSIALGIVKIAESELQKAKAKQVDEIELEIGSLAGIEFSSLDFVWPSAVENTILQHAKRTINTIPGKASCLECSLNFELVNHYDCCPECGSPFKKITQGRELRVKSLLIS